MKQPITLKGYEKQIEAAEILLKQNQTTAGRKAIKEKLALLNKEYKALKKLDAKKRLKEIEIKLIELHQIQTPDNFVGNNDGYKSLVLILSVSLDLFHKYLSANEIKKFDKDIMKIENKFADIVEEINK